MTDIPKRKNIRLTKYDYSTPGGYFITVCTANREKIFWNAVGADIIRPENVPLSPIGKIVEQSVLQIKDHYENILVDSYCIMRIISISSLPFIPMNAFSFGKSTCPFFTCHFGCRKVVLQQLGCVFHSVKTHLPIWHPLGSSNDCVAAIGAVFFVRSFGCALFMYREKWGFVNRLNHRYTHA